jgi:CYTH domain-containing protein/CHAD domain-containing protein
VTVPDRLSPAEVTELLPSALRRPAAEGARIVTLHWLFQLIDARHAWARSSDAEGLHRARVALRRLRASARSHRVVLRGDHPGRLLDATARMQRATSAARDADVSFDWLHAESDGLPPTAREQALRMMTRLAEGAAERRARVEAAWCRYLDRRADRFVTRLSSYRTEARLGDAAPPSFAEHVADTLEWSAGAIRSRLDALADLDADHLPGALHHLRIQLKRQRALLTPHLAAHPSLAAWYDVATRGQDLLGAMRDAAVLGAQARYHGADALADIVLGVALARQEAFLQGWCADLDAVTRAQHAAAAAMRGLGRAATADRMPMEFERKFLLHAIPPEASAVDGLDIEQGWIPGQTLHERLRRTTAADGTVHRTRTIKLGPASARIEVEETTDPALFDALWPLTIQQRIRKRRHVVQHGTHAWEIDVFLDRDLVVAEVELRHEFEPATMPPWLAPYVVREVTGEVQYLNAVLARTAGATPNV